MPLKKLGWIEHALNKIKAEMPVISFSKLTFNKLFGEKRFV